MGKLLYKKFLEEMIEDLSTALLHHGVEGLFNAFEEWFVNKDYLKRNGSEYEKWVFDND